MLRHHPSQCGNYRKSCDSWRLLILLSLIPATFAFSADDTVLPLSASPEADRPSGIASEQMPDSESTDKESSSSQPQHKNNKAKIGPEGSCARMKDPLGCNCALKVGGYIYPSPGSYSGYRWRYHNKDAFTQCLYAAGRR